MLRTLRERLYVVMVQALDDGLPESDVRGTTAHMLVTIMTKKGVSPSQLHRLQAAVKASYDAALRRN